MICYISTRGEKNKHLFSEAILQGIAPDGGLFVPERIPHISVEQLQDMIPLSYAERAFAVIKLFDTDFADDIVRNIVYQTYGALSKFDHPDITPLKPLGHNRYILELWHGPTWAFKDMALQLMPDLFEEAIKKDNEKRVAGKQKPLRYLLLVATSGDTGKAALAGYKDKEDIALLVLFPDKRISSIQELSMITQEGKNLAVYAVEDDFDAIQSVVKQIFSDKKFTEQIHKQYSTSLSAANSINWGRLLPQIVYHISSYVELLKNKRITMGDTVDIAVPTGNFGNILAAYIAREMGLPIRRLICASNENNVLSEFFNTGMFDISHRKLVKTPSPAMDILIASNLERLLYFVTKNCEQVKTWMEQLQQTGTFSINEQTRRRLKELFYADWVSNEKSKACIKQTYIETNYVIDPHTAVVMEVVKRYLAHTENKKPVIICSTAHWAKFPEEVYPLLLPDKQLSGNTFTMIKNIEQQTNSHVPPGIMTLASKPVLHTKKLSAKKEIIEKEIIDFINRQQ